MGSNNQRGVRMEFEELRSITAATVPVGTYVGGNIGTPFEHSVVQFKIDNMTDQALVFSKDGLTDHFVVCANGFWLSDISSNKVTDQGLQIAKGDSFYVKVLDAPPTENSVYLTIIYADIGR